MNNNTPYINALKNILTEAAQSAYNDPLVSALASYQNNRTAPVQPYGLQNNIYKPIAYDPFAIGNLAGRGYPSSSELTPIKPVPQAHTYNPYR